MRRTVIGVGSVTTFLGVLSKESWRPAILNLPGVPFLKFFLVTTISRMGLWYPLFLATMLAAAEILLWRPQRKLVVEFGELLALAVAHQSKPEPKPNDSARPLVEGGELQDDKAEVDPE